MARTWAAALLNRSAIHSRLSAKILERRGWIKASWGVSDNNRRAKYYELTKIGRKQLEIEKDAWGKLTAAMAQVLGTA